MKKAFSLIELSIVILVIGIILAGITQSSRLLNAMRLATARNITKSAPVSSISDLLLWLEPTLEESFLVEEAGDELYITTWKDVNPQVSSRNNMTRGSGDAHISYEAEGINNIPTVAFSGNTSTTTVLTGSVIAVTEAKFTVFMVLKAVDETPSEAAFVFVNGHSSTAGFSYYYPGSTDTGKKGILYGGIVGYATSTATATTNPEIVMLTCDGSTASLYTNGAAETVADSPNCSYNAISGTFRVGNSNSSELWNGFISELIVFDRVLKASEISEIENYLSKKYNITVS